MKPKEKQEINFTLLENGLDFIWSAIEHLGDDLESRKVKYAVLHLCSGIELILKERLRQEDWALVFQNPNKAKEEDYRIGQFTSVNFHECIKRLENNCGMVIDEQAKQELIEFRDMRNKLEHFRMVVPLYALKARSAGVLNFLIDFIRDHLDEKKFSKEEVKLVSNIRTKLSDFENFVSDRMASIKEKLDKSQTPILTCQTCWQDAAIISNGVSCLFCGCQQSDIDYAVGVPAMWYREIKYGGEWPVSECPYCEIDTLIKLDNGYFCLHCLQSWPVGSLEQCGRCGNYFVGSSEDEVDICPDCWKHLIESDA